ncbi:MULTISPECIES: DUF433 domain-containing protein [Rhizobium]|uniref:Uncharacterized protein (DUF433 family) n=1 Tax=Rhizobium binae TaxID=1138190 RepID=A0ABV2MKW2_9HYPH|nr:MULTISPECIES: DUF433 domain-containing protein [Rhizobium]NKL49589.1 DUF433 domain-containing protein [Rhizobium leguminosarum bv. viciae]MBX4937070.1 DUF433 domain-containing protein [Rhizobium binae]MBX4943720.1 DUF433 domain-containing protein [Rhizobium binae]MBX4979164.1 DUF433 domain-containing protein [Rhizobium binae]MBX4995901.1 DUF433 domain-containing protein [Rhizobium binae]
MISSEMLKTAEAAVVARVTLRDVNRVIDEGILPATFSSAENGRRIWVTACSLISFYYESAARLTSEERINAIRWAEPRLSEWKTLALESLIAKDWTLHHDFLTIDLAPFFRRTVENLADLEAARDMVTSSPDILGGTPVVRGTRIPVYDVAASLAAGHSVDEILEAFPALDERRIGLAKVYAEANPLRGRPKPAPELPAGARIVRDRRVARRRRPA